MPTTTGSGSDGHDPAGFHPMVTSMLTTGSTTVKGVVFLCTGGAFTLRGNNSGCYPTAARLSVLGYHCFIIDYHVRPHTQVEAGYGLACTTRFVRTHVADYSLPSAQHVVLSGYSADGILCGETILNWSRSTSPTELNADYTPGALDTMGADAAATAMTYPFYGHLSVTELDPNRLAGAVPTYYYYGIKDPFYSQFEAQAKIPAGSGVTLRAHVFDGWPYGFGAEGGWIEGYDAFLQRAFTST